MGYSDDPNQNLKLHVEVQFKIKFLHARTNEMTQINKLTNPICPWQTGGGILPTTSSGSIMAARDNCCRWTWKERKEKIKRYMKFPRKISKFPKSDGIFGIFEMAKIPAKIPWKWPKSHQNPTNFRGGPSLHLSLYLFSSSSSKRRGRGVKSDWQKVFNKNFILS